MATRTGRGVTLLLCDGSSPPRPPGDQTPDIETVGANHGRLFVAPSNALHCSSISEVADARETWNTRGRKQQEPLGSDL